MPDNSVALIMAGGEGTRMAKTRPAVPKPLVDLGGLPLIEIMIRQLLNAGFKEIRIAIVLGLSYGLLLGVIAYFLSMKEPLLTSPLLFGVVVGVALFANGRTLISFVRA